MWSFGGAVLALALFALCSDTEARAQQSERHRHRSGPIKSIPVGADVKRDTDFDCPEEFGYYPHPSDCSQYYVCVFGGALLESCTGGLMYSHELQTCDWPRNVGCDATSGAGESVERIESREPPPPPPRRAPPPPPPRVQPNPIVTSRGQPRISQDEYVKQQQLYSEIEDLPPAEEIESDRPQRVYRGQPSTIGQVQRDRDGYSSQLTSGRSFNANIIPASISQPSGKVGAFSFGTQVEQRRTANPTQQPQSYSDKLDLTDDSDRLGKEFNKIEGLNKDIEETDNTKRKLSRKKREQNLNYTKEVDFNEDHTKVEQIDRSDRFMGNNDKLLETEDGGSDNGDDRDKRQIRNGRYQNNQNGYNQNAAIQSWTTGKPVKSFDFAQFIQKPPHIFDNTGFSHFNSLPFNNNKYAEVSQKPHLSDNTVFTTARPFQQYQTVPNFQQKPFKASTPDPYNERIPFNPVNAATQIITKSPPISSLTNFKNPFATLSGGFSNNNLPRPNTDNMNSNQNPSQRQTYFHQAYPNGNSYNTLYDSSEVPTTVVTQKPVRIQPSTTDRVKYRIKPEYNKPAIHADEQNYEKRPVQEEEKREDNKEPETEDDDEEYEEESDNDDSDDEDEEGDDINNKNNRYQNIPDFPKPPIEFTQTKDKYADIVNPFADPNFDFDSFISNLRDSHLSAIRETTPTPQNNRVTTSRYLSSTSRRPIPEENKSQRLVTEYYGMSTPRPFSVPMGTTAIESIPSKTIVSWPAQSISQSTNKPQYPDGTTDPHTQYTNNNAQVHSLNKTPKLLKFPFHGDENNLQFNNQRPIEHTNNRYRQAVLNHAVSGALQSTNKPLSLGSQFKNENIRQSEQYSNVNEYESSQNRPQELSKYTLNGDEHKSSQTYRPNDNVNHRLKPPNFKDDRRLPINYNFNSNVGSFLLPNPENNKNNYITKDGRQIITVTQKPYITAVTRPSPALYTAKPQFSFSPNPQTGRPQVLLSGKIQYFSTAKPQTMINQQSTISGFRPYSLSTKAPYISSTEVPNYGNQFVQSITPPSRINPNSNKIIYHNSSISDYTTTTIRPTPKRRPIPKPSPEMNDYYYDDDDEYYYEPAVKSQFMPSSEVRPQRPLIAQNDEEYEDEEYDDDNEEQTKVTDQITYRRPATNTNYQSNNQLKHQNDISVPTKAPLKQGSSNNVNGKIPVPVMMSFVTSTPSILKRPQVANYEVMHTRTNKTRIRRPMLGFRESGPHTEKPPKYLNQTTLRPYTVRHRLAKPTTAPMMHMTTDPKQVRGQNKWKQTTMKSTTSHDSHNQETRFTKNRHDDKRMNSLEPTESVTPVSFSPRPTAGRALYNGSQNYNPDQYDPYYALYDDDGEVFKDSDYVQQYNSASIRPAVQQTYRGTPPPQPAPTRRPPQDIYTPRPVSADEYDDALIQGQIDDNQYQQPIRQSTRGEGNELGYEHIPSSVRTTIYEATSISTTPSTTTSTSSTTTTTTTTQRPTSAPITEAMTPSRNTQRSPSDGSISRSNASATEYSPTINLSSIPSPVNPINPVNFSSFAKPFQRTSNSFRLKDMTFPNKSVSFHRGVFSNLSKPQTPTISTRTVSNNKHNPHHFSLTTGFSIRKDPNNSQSPYTLTVISRPSTSDTKKQINDEFSDSEKSIETKYIYDQIPFKSKNKHKQDEEINISQRRLDTESGEFVYHDIDKNNAKEESMEILSTLNEKESDILQTNAERLKEEVSTDNQSSDKSSSRVYLKTIIKRPAPFTLNKEDKYSIEKNEGQEKNWLPLIEKTFEISQRFTSTEQSITKPSNRVIHAPRNRTSFAASKSIFDFREPTVSPYRSLENLKIQNLNYDSKQNIKSAGNENTYFEYLKSPSAADSLSNENVYKIKSYKTQQPAIIKEESSKKYTTYKPLNQDSTDIIIKNISEPTLVKLPVLEASSDPTEERENITNKSNMEAKTVNIGFSKRINKYPPIERVLSNNRRIQILNNEQTKESFNAVYDYKETEQPRRLTSKEVGDMFYTVVTPTPHSSTHEPFVITTSSEAAITTLHVTPKYDNSRRHEESYEYTTYTSKFDKIVHELPSTKLKEYDDLLNNDNRELENNIDIISNNVGTDLTKQTKTRLEPVPYPYPLLNETFDRDMETIVTTTQMTMKVIESTTQTAKTTPFPTRASRINPAIKLAATNPGGGRRSYQSSSKCSTDNSLQANPKCNEIKYQRTNTRGRGSAHYSTSSGADAPSVNNVNRGTPPARLRPTLKPSTSIVSKETVFVDIYQNGPSRPPAIYPQPTPDKTAAKCRKDVCLLPDCNCGGKDIPGNLPVNEVPQLVLITFDDAVNDLNKDYYKELFEKGRVNPNSCPIAATFYVSHEWTDYSQVQNLYADGHELASHTISHSFGEQFSQKKWNREVGGQREILAAYGGVKLEDVRGMRAPFLSVGGNKMFKMLYDSNFTYDSSMPVYENRPPSWPYTLDYKLFHDCMIPPCPTRSYPGVWEVPMVMWQDLNGGRCSMGDACSNPPNAEGVYKMLLKNFDRHYTTNRAPFGLFYHAAWFTQPHHKEGFIMFMDAINQMKDVFFVTNWQALQWVRDPTPLSRINQFQPFQCDYPDRPKRCNNPKVCNLWHKSGVRYMRTCQPCPEVYPWTGKTGIRSSKIDNDIEE